MAKHLFYHCEITYNDGLTTRTEPTATKEYAIEYAKIEITRKVCKWGNGADGLLVFRHWTQAELHGGVKKIMLRRVVYESIEDITGVVIDDE